MRVGRLALMTPVMTSTDGRCVAMIRWMPAARAFCASRWIRNSTSLPAVIIRSASSSTTTTICGSDLVVELLHLVARLAGLGIVAGLDPAAERLALHLGLAHLGVEAGELAHADRRHHPIALLHLLDRPFERADRLGGLGHHRREQMRDVVVDAQLEHLRIDQDHLALLGRQPVEQRQDHAVEADRLARAGGAGDEQVRHRRQVGDDRIAGDVLAEDDRQLRDLVLEGGAADQLGQDHHLALGVGQLDADHAAAGNGRDARRQRRHVAGDIVGELDDPARLDARWPARARTW